MSDLKYIKVQLKDNNEIVEYIGTFKNQNASHVIINTILGTMSLPKNEVKLFSSSKEEHDKLMIRLLPDKSTDKTIVHHYVPKEHSSREPNSDSKVAKALALYKSMIVDGRLPNRQDVINAFVDQIGLTPLGASTYNSNIRKMLS